MTAREESSVSGSFLESHHKSKTRLFISSLRRLLGKSSSVKQLRDLPGRPSAAPGSPAAYAQGSQNVHYHQVGNSPLISNAGPRPATSMPLLELSEQLSPATSRGWPFLKQQSSHLSTRNLALAPSQSALSVLPSVDLSISPFSTGTMANNLRSSGIQSSNSAVSKHVHELLASGASSAGRDEPTAAAAAAEVIPTAPRDGSKVLVPCGRKASPPICIATGRPLPAGASPLAPNSAPIPFTSCVTPSPTALPGNCPPAATAFAAADAAPISTLLASCPAAPEAMRRPVWRLSDYILGGRIYRGEVSSVYKAVCGVSGVKVVLKVYSLARVADNALHTLVREVRIHTDTAHANVLMMYGVFEEGNRLVLVLERALRGDLLAVRTALPRGRMSEDQLRVLVLAPLLDALVYLHARGVCHRDIKPENLLMTATWQLRVADFGASINLNKERAVTRTGTTDYMAPEVERCPLKMLPEDNKDDLDLAYTTAADVWSAGVLAYEMLVGFPPFINCSAGDGGGNGEGAGGAGGGGDGEARRELCFPHFVSAGGQDFISCALAERPMDRPTAAQLLRHPWLKHALSQHQTRQQQQPAVQQLQQQQLQRPSLQQKQLSPESAPVVSAAPAADPAFARLSCLSRRAPFEMPSRLHFNSSQM